MDHEKNGEKKKLDLSIAQVSGSAVAAVVAAKLASTLGVYGTILGAGVISVIATCGGSIFHHLFTRTGEQIREVTVHTEPSKGPAGRRAPERTQVLTTVGGPPAPPPYGAESGEEFGAEFGAATTHGTRVRGWKRSAVGAALVFLVAMGGITSYELISDQDFSGTKGSTTFGSVVRGGEAKSERPPAEDEPSRQQEQQEQQERRGQQGGDPSEGNSPGTGGNTPDPAPTPSRSGGGDPAPTPTPTPTSPPTTTPSGGTPTPTPPTGTPSTGTDAGAGGQEDPPAE
ncbi:hypothetical protein M5362_04915 [Streptomyces sp. Je 1-79]|uniref:hypothetical protein n=1 Tax=Streptomyces sp. Je 1-79 TaxID=2943847 RepID=UPI0021A398FA|nr:hypothetical protein [Streptomyces sp. Je 1-79]MCT4352473.1 hypothetical protein [Streptomyces sp. Je 1-79]